MSIACASSARSRARTGHLLVTDGVIFDYSRFMDIRNRDVVLPANEYRQFKIVVEQELDDRESPLRELIRGQRQGRQEGHPQSRSPANLRTPFRIDRVELWRTCRKRQVARKPRSSPYPTAGFRVEHDAKEKVSRVDDRKPSRTAHAAFVRDHQPELQPQGPCAGSGRCVACRPTGSRLAVARS